MIACHPDTCMRIISKATFHTPLFYFPSGIIGILINRETIGGPILIPAGEMLRDAPRFRRLPKANEDICHNKCILASIINDLFLMVSG